VESVVVMVDQEGLLRLLELLLFMLVAVAVEHRDLVELDLVEQVAVATDLTELIHQF
jgi:hypothetical protein